MEAIMLQAPTPIFLTGVGITSAVKTKIPVKVDVKPALPNIVNTITINS